MIILLTIIHVLVCLFLIVVVLLQSGKAADLAGAFGGMGSQTAFGPRGAATVLTKATTIAAGLFMVTSISLSILATRNAGVSSTVLEKHKAPAKATETKKAAEVPSTGPSVTVFPEGAEGQGVTTPITLPPKPEEGKAPAAPAKK
ncbi:MAG: preprotein translocase subunit SecG [Acidimicrobiia bacterium]|nr:preprotein translocase subunit SecG [Acidimicrobiia bacterium]